MPSSPLHTVRALARATRRGFFPRWAAVLAAAVLGAAPAAAQGVLAPAPDTLRIVNTATLAYQGEDGVAGHSTSTAEVVLEQRAGVSLTPPRQDVIVPGARRVFAHTLGNVGTGRDRFRLVAAAPAGWTVALWLDVDGDGALSGKDTQVTGPVALAQGQQAAVLAVVDAPAGLAEGTQVQVEVKATSALNAAAEASLQDRLTVHVPLAQVSMTKTVDRSLATTGDTLAYVIGWANHGDGATGDAHVDDVLPAGLRYVPGSITLNGRALTDTADADAGAIERDAGGHETVRVRLGQVAAGDSGKMRFRATVAPGAAAGGISNVATLGWDTTSVASPAAGTDVRFPRMMVQKERLGADTVTVGGEIVFRITYGNLSTDVAVLDAVLTDSLPEILTYVSADVTPEVVDGRVLRWHLGTLAPGATGTVTVRTRAGMPAGGAVASAVNRVVARGANAEAVSAAAAALQVTAFDGNELKITKAAGVLEAGPGDAIPYTVTLRNAGAAPLRGIVLHDVLPSGVRLVDGSLSGADSMRVAGRELTIWWAGPLLGGDQHPIRYAAIMVAAQRGGTLANKASGEAEGGLVHSDTATAWVRVRRGFAMQQRALVGKVWIDLNDNGRQDEGEPGLAGAEVWSADGQVVTTDREGRYSIADVQPGTQLLRLDTVTVPRGLTVAGRQGDQRVVRIDGWTLPQANFRVVPRPGAEFRLPTAPPAPGAPTPAAATTPGNPAVPTPSIPAAVQTPPPAEAPTATVDTAAVPGLASLPALPSAPAAEPRTVKGRTVAPELAECPLGGAVAQGNAVTLDRASVARSLGTAERLAAAGAPAQGGPSAVALEVEAPKPAAVSTARPAAAAAASTSIAPAALPADTAGPRVAPLRSADERAADKRSEFMEGPSVAIFSPVDGAVVGTNRVYVGVRGEPGAAVKLFDGSRQVAEGQMRPDGVMDFVNVELAPGPHHLRAAMQSSWGKERWDSVAVHRSGEPARFEAPASAPVLRADARDTVRVLARVLDHWGVPVAGQPRVTVEARGATPAGQDGDASSVGFQVAVQPDGTLAVPLVAGHDAGPGAVSVVAAKARGTLPIRVYPSSRPLFATGIGVVGVGAAPESFGAMTVRGAIGSETSVRVSVDSRRNGDDTDFFGRGYDPLDESRYPTLGDGSDRRVFSSATQAVSARVEHGFDWLELGDINTTGFGGGAQLGGYQRSLTGVGGRVATGAVVWRAFGSLTDQALVQRQLRGDGTSGPYTVGGSIRPGTDRVAIEIRARENAARVIARQELQRFVDYQIDYTTGEILLQRPVPSADADGDPVYVVATVESRSGGKQRVVGGLRMEVDARQWLRSAKLDSLGLGVYGVRDAAGTGVSGATVNRGLVGGDLRIKRNGLDVGAELLRSATADSAALAGHADASFTLPGDRARLSAEWMRVGQGFSGSADPRLSSGLQEIRLAAEAQLAAGSRLQLSHERERFDQYGVSRNNTRLQLQQSVAGRTLTAEGGMATDVQATASSSSAVGKLTFSPMDRVDVWMEGTRNLDAARGDNPTPVTGRPNAVGAGVAVRVLPRTKLEASHRWVWLPGDTARDYQLTAFNVRTQAILGGQVWGGLERADDSRSSHYLALGWDQNLQLAGGWQLTSMFERRFGVSKAALSDPTRALPFAQAELDRWSAGLGVDWLPADGRPRLSAHGELHDGAETRGHRLDVAGDAPLGLSVALLGRSEWLQEYHLTGNGLEESRRDRSLVGMAFRPVGLASVNALAKLEWRRTLNPIGTSGVLGAAGADTRLIGSTDVVWSPRDGTEVAARYALRWTLADPSLPDVASLGARAQYMGLRLDREVRGPFAVRLDSRLLTVGSGNGQQWSASPSLVASLGRQLELEGGYRFGNLLDPDFGAGGEGFFATLGFHFSEGTLGSAAAFWRDRLAH